MIYVVQTSVKQNSLLAQVEKVDLRGANLSGADLRNHRLLEDSRPSGEMLITDAGQELKVVEMNDLQESTVLLKERLRIKGS